MYNADLVNCYYSILYAHYYKSSGAGKIFNSFATNLKFVTKKNKKIRIK